MFDFPNSPTLNQTVTAPNGGVFVWDSTKWTTAENAVMNPGSGLYLPISGGTLTGAVVANVTTSATTTLAQPFASHWTVSGTQTSGQPYGWMFDVVDNLDARPLGALNAFFIDDVVGANAGGGRNGLLTVLALTAPTRDALSGPHALFYNGMSVQVTSSTNQGGVSGNTSANLVGIAIQTIAQSGATYMNMVEGMEVGVGVLSGASASYVNAFKAMPEANGIAPLICFNAYAIGGALPGTTGFNMGLCFCEAASGPGHFGIAPTGTLIGTNLAGTVAHGIDLTLITCTSDQFKGTGILIDGSGHVAPLLANAANDAAAATAGVPVGAMYRNGNAVQVRVV